MDAHLVCKIVTHTASGDKYRGSGYPITPNRIITAAHVIDDAAPAEGHAPEANARRIELLFGVNEETVQGPVAIAWSGTPVGVDVAVLRCELPPEWQPGHELLTEPFKTLIDWYARGYTEFGRARQAGGKDAYYGKLVPFAGDEPTVSLGCEDGLVSSEQWAGGSGSVAFSSPVPQAVAVITDYRGGKKQDHLVAVPLSYLLDSDLTRDDFRRAIQFCAYQRRKDYCSGVVEIVASKLRGLEEALLKQMAEKIIKLPGVSAPEIDIEKSSEILARQTAACLVGHRAVTSVVGCLVSLRQAVGRSGADQIAGIIDHVLPLNYAPNVIQRLREQVDEHRLGWIEDEVSTRTLAEVIMAGYDQQPTKFVNLTAVRGQVAFDYVDVPEEGPSDPGSNRAMQRAIRNFLRDLVALKGTLLSGQSSSLSQGRHQLLSDADLAGDIKGDVQQLRGALTAIGRIYPGRTVYCVLAPPKDASQRAMRKSVLSAVHQYLPELVFVELLPADQADEREFEVEMYVQACLIRT